jgi:Tol biopolymer transport system component
VHGKVRNLYEKNADGTGDERLLHKSELPATPLSASDDGKFLLFVSGTVGDQGLFLLSLGDGKTSTFVNTSELELAGQISPGSKWISYNVVGPNGPELFVRPFPRQPGGQANPDASKWSVATGVTVNIPARWSADGRRLMYLTQSGDLMAVDLEPGPAFNTTGPPTRLVTGLAPGPWSPDPQGPRFLTMQLPSNSGPPPPFTLVLNWLPQLER